MEKEEMFFMLMGLFVVAIPFLLFVLLMVSLIRFFWRKGNKK